MLRSVTVPVEYMCERKREEEKTVCLSAWMWCIFLLLSPFFFTNGERTCGNILGHSGRRPRRRRSFSFLLLDCAHCVCVCVWTVSKSWLNAIVNEKKEKKKKRRAR